VIPEEKPPTKKIQKRRAISFRPALHAKIVSHCEAAGEPVARFAERVLGEAIGWETPRRPIAVKPPPPKPAEAARRWGPLRPQSPHGRGRPPNAVVEARLELRNKERAGSSPALGVKAPPRPGPTKVQVPVRTGGPRLL
jgi:hypothetical protein